MAEFETYFSQRPNMSTAVTALESVNLLVRGVDPDDARFATATITPLGWLVHHHRSRYALPQYEPGLADSDPVAERMDTDSPSGSNAEHTARPPGEN